MRDRIGVPVSTLSSGSSLSALKAAKTRSDLAHLLGYRPSGLTAIIYKIPEALKYTTFDIPKKSGGTRQIAAPRASLKLLQRILSDLLYECLTEIEADTPHLFRSQYGYLPNKTIYDNAFPHRSKRYVLNVDISNFFETINFGRVRGFFIKDSRFHLEEEVATTIAQIACWNNCLPQGSPCSPVISNLLGGILDARMAKLAKDAQVQYTRYVDDLTFSTNNKILPSSLATFDPTTNQWALSAELLDRVSSAGFALNTSKTRVQVRQSRQIVTGLVVNRIVNVRRSYILRARAAVHAFATSGAYDLWPSREKVAAGIPLEKEKTPNRLEAILEFIHKIKDQSDLRQPKKKKQEPSAVRKLYSDLIFSKHFIRADRPVLICEGKTDNLYIISALKALSSTFPDLGEWKGGVFHPHIKLFRYSIKTQEMLSLGGGSGDLSKLVRDYRKTADRYTKTLKPNYPVMILVDNDKGGASVFNAVKDLTGSQIKISDPRLHFHVFENLYIIKTPHISGSNQSCIEQMFDSVTLSTKLGGKTFDFLNDDDTATTYGKHIFSEKVIRPNWDKLNFSGFLPMLSAIREIIKDHT